MRQEKNKEDKTEKNVWLTILILLLAGGLTYGFIRFVIYAAKSLSWIHTPTGLG